MTETPGAFDFIDSLLRGDLNNAKDINVAKPEYEEVTVIKSSAPEQSAQQIVDDDLLIFEKPADVKTKPHNNSLLDTILYHEDSDDIVDAIEEIEVIDGMALLQEDVKDYRKEHNEVFMETGVEEGQPLAPSKRRKHAVPANPFPVQHVEGTYFVEKGLRINHLELMVGGPIPSDSQGKIDLITRLRLFIDELNNHLEKSEDKRNVLKREYSKKMIEVKESEELVEDLTGRLSEQATVVREQMIEVEHARSVRREKPPVEANNVLDEGIILPSRLAQIVEGKSDDQWESFPMKSVHSGEDLYHSQETLIGQILAKDSFPGFTYKLTIKKAPLGFTLKRKDGAEYCKVWRISRNDLKKSGLVTGLQILSVNEVSLKNLTLPQVQEILEMQEMPVEIRMRRALTPWQKYNEFQTTSWGTKKAVTTWTFYCSRNKPRIVVLEHNQRKGKSKRKVTIDGGIRYENKSTKDSFQFTIESDTIYLKITRGKDAIYNYDMRINELSFEDSKTSFIITRTETESAINFV